MIAKHERIEEKLRESESKYRELIQNANSAIIRWKRDGTITFFNEYAQAFFGYSEDEVIGKHVGLLVPETESTGSDLPSLVQDIVIHPERYVQNINENICRDGKRVWMAWTNKAVLDEDGNVKEILAVGSDFTERKHSEDTIRHKNSILDGINRIFKEALTCETEEQLGRLCLKVSEELTQSKFGFIGKIGPDGLLHDIAISDPGWELCTMYDKSGHRRPPGDFRLHGLYGRVLTDGKSLITNDPFLHPDSIGTPKGHPPLKAFLGVPLIQNGETIGMIAMGNREGGYTKQQQDALEAIAPSMVQALLRKRVEEALRKSEERLRMALDAAYLISFEWDIQRNEVRRFVSHEPALVTTSEAKPGSFEDVVEAVHPDDRVLFRDNVHMALEREDGAYESEFRLVRPDGASVWLHERGRVERDAEGRPARLIGLSQDITERKQAEEALRESERKYRIVADNTHDFEFWRDPKGHYLYISPSCQRISGYSPLEFSVDPALARRMVHRDDLDRFDEHIRMVEGRHSFGDLEYRIVHRDGTIRWVAHACQPVFDEEGNYLGVRGSNRDITERKEGDLLLRASEARFRSLVESNIIGVVVADPLTGEVFDANDAYLRILGCCREELQAGKVNWKAATPLEDLEQETTTVAAHLLDGRIAPFDKTYIRRDGSKAHVIIGGSYMVNDPGKVIAFVLDVTERRQAEQTLRESEERISASLAEKEVLLKEIHHRVKNNMQVISSLISLQADQLQDAGTRAVLQDVTHRVRSMALVHEKLYHSPDLARVDFAEYARSLLNYLWRAHGSAASGIKLALDLEPISLSVDTAVPCGLILNELASNALKHAFRGGMGGEVAVSLRGSPAGQVRLCVRDNGRGLPEGFDWKQANTLGLRLVQMLTGQLHAAVEVSTLEGTEFSVTFEISKT